MADTIRSQIIAEVIRRFAGITTAAGYNTNLGDHIFHWHPRSMSAGDLPACNIRDRSDECKPIAQGRYQHVISVDLDIAAANGADTIEDAYNLMQDIYTAIGVDHTWGGRAYKTDIIRTEIVLEQEDRTIAGITVTMAIEYHSARWAI